MKLLPITMPLRGLNTVNPDVPFDSGYAREFSNLAIVNARVIGRPGIKTLYRNLTVNSAVSWFDPDALTGIVTSTGQLTSMTGSSAPFGGIGGACLYPATTFKHASIEVLCGCREPRQTADPYTSHGFTSTVITMTAVRAGCSYKGRPFFTDGTTVIYGDIGQVTGAIATDGLSGGSFDVSKLLAGQICVRLFALTAQPGNNANTIFVAFGAQGKVLVYSGGWPDSDDWQLIGDYSMPQLSSTVSFIELDGDLIIGTTDYPYSFQDLFSGGPKAAYDNRISAPIDNLWRSLYWSNDALNPGTWNAEELPAAFRLQQLTREDNGTIARSFDALCFRCSHNRFSRLNRVADYGSDATILVYFRQYKAWAVWFTFPYWYPIRPWAANPNSGPIGSYKASIAQFNSDRWIDEYITNTSTLQKQIYASWKTPFASIYEGKNQKVSGVRTFFAEGSEVGVDSPFKAEINKVKSIFDYSDSNSPWGFWTQPNVGYYPLEPAKSGEATISIAESTSQTYTALANPGGTGGCVGFQFVLTQNSTQPADYTYFQEIFAATALIEDGGVKF